MVRLEHMEFEDVLNVVRAVGDARGPAEFSRVVVSQLAKLIPSDAVALNEVDPLTGRTTYVAEPESFVVPPALVHLLVAMADEHPLIRY
jgi:hypothetical protein